MADRLAPLRADGAPDQAFEQLRAPIGLDIGGKAPWEVAVSVIGEIMALRYARPAAAPRPAPRRRRRSAGGRRTRASASAKTVTSEESWSRKGADRTPPSA